MTPGTDEQRAFAMGAGGVLGGGIASIPVITAGARDLARNFTTKGAEQKAGSILRNAASSADDAVANLYQTRPAVPGSTPTTGMASGDEGIAGLLNVVQDRVPSVKAAASRAATARETARTTFAGKVGGTADDLAAMEAARDSITRPMREAVLSRVRPIPANSLTDPLTLRPIDVFDPAYQRFRDLLPAAVAGNYNLRSFFSLREKEYWYAVTAQDVVRLHPRLTLAITGRYDIVANVSSGNCLQTTPCNVAMQEVEDDVFSPRVGASFDALPWLAIYGSYARSFGSPTGASVLADGSPAGFERGEQKEAGLKGHWFDDRLTASLAFYHLTKSDLAVTTILPGVGVVADVVGEARSQGIELDIRGDLTDRLSLLASYAFTDARVTEDQDVAGTPPVLTDGRKGLRLANVPEQAASIWVNYSISDAFGVGGGVFAMTEREVDADNLVEIPGYVRLDLAARYRHRFGRSWLTAQFNVNNLLDKEYFDPQTSFAQTVNASPAAPRTVLGSVRVEF